ncbi:MAG TPA: hypothetical protein VMX13_11345 [Sedimentisphaerales bacterium]|nr:hypothetical protein [Sedimentisphaerales bacterium]
MGEESANHREEEKENEENACNAFIEILKKIKGVEYIIKCRPDKSNSETKDVDFILAPKDEDCQSPRIAVEHTIIEAHGKQIAYVNQSYDVVEKINQRCQGKLPTNRWFQIVIPPALITDTSKENRGQFIKEMSNWIPDIAETLTTDDQWASELYNGHEVLLICRGSFLELNGKIGRMPTRPKEAKKEGQNRFRRAIEEKLPKLIKYKEKEYTTALLLEDVSFSHSNPGDNLEDLIPNQYHAEFELKIDYVVIFVSNEKKMIVGQVWKEKDKLYSTIPENRRFSSFNQ